MAAVPGVRRRNQKRIKKQTNRKQKRKSSATCSGLQQVGHGGGIAGLQAVRPCARRRLYRLQRSLHAGHAVLAAHFPQPQRAGAIHLPQIARAHACRWLCTL